jgi:Family of unknown function (DUF6439)
MTQFKVSRYKPGLLPPDKKVPVQNKHRSINLLAVTNAAGKAKGILAIIFGKIGLVAHRIYMSLSQPILNATSISTQSMEPRDTLVLAQQLAHELTIGSEDWHRLKSNRRARALEQAAVALVYLLKDQPEEALARLQQATGWLDRTISAPPCPTHGHHQTPSSSLKDV